jgi:hypothetical protein
MSKKDRIAEFLAQGLTASQVSSIVGCTPAYISQLAKDEEFAALLLLKKEAAPPPNHEDVLLTNKYLSLEHKLLTQLENTMQFAELRDVTRALEVVGNRQEKRASRLATPATQGSNTTVHVSIMLPAHAIPEYTINQQKEVTSIGDRAMAPMSSIGVKALFNQITASKQQASVPALTNEVPADF